MQTGNPFSRNDVMVLGFLHFGLIGGVVVFLAVVLGLNQSQALPTWDRLDFAIKSLGGETMRRTPEN